MTLQTFTATVPPQGYGPDWLRQEFMAVQRALPTAQNPMSYAMLPTGSGSWDSGTGTTITITRALTVTGAFVGSTSVTAPIATFNTTADVSVVIASPTHATFASTAFRSAVTRAANAGFYHFYATSNGVEMAYIRGDGAASFAATVTTAGSVVVGASAVVQFAGRSFLDCGADGLLRITNAAGTDFGRLQFGGTTSSFPALKRSTTVLQARLADDSDYAPFAAKTYNVNGTAGASGTGTVLTQITVVDGIVTAITVA